MIRYKIIVAYDGTDYFGWQRQPEQSTIAGTLEETFSRIFNRPISVLGASRTDAGVHALGQVASFDTDLNIPENDMKEAWNRLLAPTILIRSLEKGDDAYNPHNNVEYKIYEYLFFQDRFLL